MKVSPVNITRGTFLYLLRIFFLWVYLLGVYLNMTATGIAIFDYAYLGSDAFTHGVGMAYDSDFFILR